MELKHKLNPRVIFVGLYFVCFLAYIIVGLQPAEAVEYTVDSSLEIPSISLSTDVAKVDLQENELVAPDTIAGSFSFENNRNKVLLIGHSTTVFQNLEGVKIGDTIKYAQKNYHVTKLQFIEKSAINMNEVLKDEAQDTIVIMTCAGTLFDDGDATHRFIVTAVADDLDN